MDKDYYAVLDLLPTASPDTVKAAYRSKAKELHPDRGADVEAMAEVNEAYSVLRDPSQRAAYDERRLREAPGMGSDRSDAWGRDSDFEDHQPSYDEWGSEADWADVVDDPPAPPPPPPQPDARTYPWESGGGTAPYGHPPPAAYTQPATVSWRPNWPALPKGDPAARAARVATWVSAGITALVIALVVVSGLITDGRVSASDVLVYIALTAVALFFSRRRAAGLSLGQGGYGFYLAVLAFGTSSFFSSDWELGAASLIWTLPFLTMVELRCRYFRSLGIR